MIKNRNEFRVVVDVDNTLIIHGFNSLTPNTTLIVNPNDGAKHYVKIHQRHVELIRQYRARGMYVTVWSNNGVDWAEAVVKAINLEDYVHEVSTKPIKHLDDQSSADSIVGSRVYIPFDEHELYGGNNGI